MGIKKQENNKEVPNQIAIFKGKQVRKTSYKGE